MDAKKVIEAGNIAKEVKIYAKTIVKKNVPLIELAEKIENKIVELGGKCAFPVNLSIDNIAAHYTPTHDDKTLAHGLLKVDFGVHIDGWTADNAVSFDLENNEENKKLIESAQTALKNAIKSAKKGIKINEIGLAIQKSIEKDKFNPVINLSGHEMKKYELHSGLTIPNIDDHREETLKEGLYAIEPFVSNGLGKIHDGKPSGIYQLISEKNVRSPFSREVLKFIIKEYSTLPFCSRWIIKKFGAKSSYALRELESNGNINQFDQLVENVGVKIAQAENTILVEKDKVIVTTE